MISCSRRRLKSMGESGQYNLTHLFEGFLRGGGIFPESCVPENKTKAKKLSLFARFYTHVFAWSLHLFSWNLPEDLPFPRFWFTAIPLSPFSILLNRIWFLSNSCSIQFEASGGHTNSSPRGVTYSLALADGSVAGRWRAPSLTHFRATRRVIGIIFLGRHRARIFYHQVIAVPSCPTDPVKRGTLNYYDLIFRCKPLPEGCKVVCPFVMRPFCNTHSHKLIFLLSVLDLFFML